MAVLSPEIWGRIADNDTDVDYAGTANRLQGIEEHGLGLLPTGRSCFAEV